jgi:hypothetical protein
MFDLKSPAWPVLAAAPRRRWSRRHLAAAVLHRGAALLADWAQRLAAQAARTEPPRAQARLEFHAESGAPEGALYLDGQLIGWLSGVRRL